MDVQLDRQVEGVHQNKMAAGGFPACIIDGDFDKLLIVLTSKH